MKLKIYLLFGLVLTALFFAGREWLPITASYAERTTEVKAHVTLYVGGELLRDGGTVIVTSVPIPEAELRNMAGDNLAERDPENEKRAQLSENDLLFGARVHGRVNFVEMYYPENGTFGYNFVVDPREIFPKDLVTEQLLIGSSRWPDPDNAGKWIDADVSTIYVDGPKASKSMSRLVRASETRIEQLSPLKQTYQGVVVETPTIDQLKTGTSGEFK